MQRVYEAYKRRALIPLLTGVYLVRSQKNATGGSNISVEPDTNIRVSLDPQGDSLANKIDGEVSRYTYYGEFMERVTLLREGILKGKLDEVMVLDPTMILHGISGLNGELLKAIGWDPLKGETYNRFANDWSSNTLKKFDAIYDQIRNDREEFSKNFQNLMITLSQSINQPSTNAPVTNDNKVIPLKRRPGNPSLEHVLKAKPPPKDSLDDMLEAKPPSEAERGNAGTPKKADINDHRVKEDNQKEKDPAASN